MVDSEKFVGKITGTVLEGDQKGKPYEFEIAVQGVDCAFYIDGGFCPVHEAVAHFAPGANWVRYVTFVKMPPPDDGTEAPWIAARRKCSIEKADLEWSGVSIKVNEGLITTGITVNGKIVEGLYEVELLVNASEKSRGVFKIWPEGSDERNDG